MFEIGDTIQKFYIMKYIKKILKIKIKYKSLRFQTPSYFGPV